MARRSATREAKKLKDKWKAKQWYSVIAPMMFNRAKIGETLADEPEKLLGRTIEVTLADLIGDYKYMHIKLRFKIVDHSTSEAYTRFIGHDLTSDFIRRQTRRKRTKMEGVFDTISKDGYRIRIKPMAISDKRIQSSVQYQIRKRMDELVTKMGEDHTFSEIVSLILTSDRTRSLGNTIQKECKIIYPLKRVDVRRLEVLEIPSGEDASEVLSADLVPLPAEPGDEPEPETADDGEKLMDATKEGVTEEENKAKDPKEEKSEGAGKEAK